MLGYLMHFIFYIESEEKKETESQRNLFSKKTLKLRKYRNEKEIKFSLYYITLQIEKKNLIEKVYSLLYSTKLLT